MKLARAREAWHIASTHAAGARSWLAILSAYASTLRSATDEGLVSVRLRIDGSESTLRMRKCDIYTVAEVLDEYQYRLVSRLPEQPVIVDAGANIGVSALWFLARSPQARLHCIEPASSNFSLLRENLASDPRVNLIRAAVGSDDTTTTLKLAGHGAMHSLVDSAHAVGEEAVDCLRLDSLMQHLELERIDLLKLDVEGSELDALKGLGDRIGDIGVVAGEVHEELVDVAAFYGYLAQHDFEIVQRRQFPSSSDDRVHMFEAANRRAVSTTIA